jgi:hypothetical protein
LVDKLVGKEGSWFEWEQWWKKESLGSRSLMDQNYQAMEDANGGLSISEEYFPTIGWNNKEVDDYER